MSLQTESDNRNVYGLTPLCMSFILRKFCELGFPTRFAPQTSAIKLINANIK